MTGDEKLAVIAGNLREATQIGERSKCLAEGVLFELAAVAADCDDEQSALDLARLVISEDQRMLLADFCRLYHKYVGKDEDILSGTDMDAAEQRSSVIIPEIARLDEALLLLSENGIDLRFDPRHIVAPLAQPLRGTPEAHLRGQIEQKHRITGLQPQLDGAVVVAVDDPAFFRKQLLQPGIKIRPGNVRPVRLVPDGIQIIQGQPGQLGQFFRKGSLARPRAADDDGFFHTCTSSTLAGICLSVTVTVLPSSTTS